LASLTELKLTLILLNANSSAATAHATLLEATSFSFLKDMHRHFRNIPGDDAVSSGDDGVFNGAVLFGDDGVFNGSNALMNNSGADRLVGPFFFAIPIVVRRGNFPFVWHGNFQNLCPFCIGGSPYSHGQSEDICL
jgi:hypothetical protein